MGKEANESFKKTTAELQQHGTRPADVRLNNFCANEDDREGAEKSPDVEKLNYKSSLKRFEWREWSDSSLEDNLSAARGAKRTIKRGASADSVSRRVQKASCSTFKPWVPPAETAADTAASADGSSSGSASYRNPNDHVAFRGSSKPRKIDDTTPLTSQEADAIVETLKLAASAREDGAGAFDLSRRPQPGVVAAGQRDFSGMFALLLLLSHHDA